MSSETFAPTISDTAGVKAVVLSFKFLIPFLIEK